MTNWKPKPGCPQPPSTFTATGPHAYCGADVLAYRRELWAKTRGCGVPEIATPPPDPPNDEAPLAGEASNETHTEAINTDIIAVAQKISNMSALEVPAGQRPEFKLSVIRFASIKVTQGKRNALTWSRLCEMLSDPEEHPDIESLPLFAFAMFPGDSRKSGSRPTEMTAIVGDYDGGVVSVEEAEARLKKAGIMALVYTTRRHRPEKPRWRVIAALSAPIKPDEYPEYVDSLNGGLGGILASESWEVTRNYFYGKVRDVPYQFVRIDGEATLDAWLVCGTDWQPIGKPDHKGLPAKCSLDKTTDSKRGTDADALGAKFERADVLDHVTSETIADVRSAMTVFTKGDADDYKFWIDKMGHALKSLAQAGYSDAALALWHEFSKLSAKYKFAKAQAKWDGINPNKITYKSIFAWADERGWVNPKSALALKRSVTAATRIDRTDAGNTALLAKIVEGNLRYIPERKAWMWWTGERWEVKQHKTVAQAQALQVAEHYLKGVDEARKLGADPTLDLKGRALVEKDAENTQKWARSCREKRRIDAMLGLASCDARFTVAATSLDTDHWLLGVDNGVVDLRTGQLRQAGRDEYVTKRSPVRFNPEAKAPRFAQFITEITSEPARGRARPRPQLAAYLVRALGYSLTGSTVEHKMFMAIGAGSNGKNVLLDLMQRVLGPYCTTMPVEALMASRYDADSERATPAARRLAGARMAVSSESKDGQRLDVTMVKKHTGGGNMSARGLHENGVEFEISHKLWLMTNNVPTLDHLDDALRGRLHLIPFSMSWNRPGHSEPDKTLPDGDKDLPAKLNAELEGILAMLIDGARQYHLQGLEPPDEVARMTSDYFKSQDPFRQWLDTQTKCSPKNGRLASVLHQDFQGWCVEEGYMEADKTTQIAFSRKLKSAGIEHQRLEDGNRYGLLPKLLKK